MKKKLLMLAVAVLGFCSVASAQKVAVGTNVIQWADLGAINLELSIAASTHITVNAGGRYNPWYFERGTDAQMQNRKRGAWLGMRYWPWYCYSGWFIQGKAQWQEYNHYFPNVTDVKEEGDAIGGGIAAGYALMVNPHFNIEFGLGAWAGMKIYNEDALPERGRRLTEHATKFFVLPDDVCVTLVFVF